MPKTETPIVLAGVGYTKLSRKPERSEIDLAYEACRSAAEDAGLDPSDLDGINVQVHHHPIPDTQAIARRLGMKKVQWMKTGGMGVVPLGCAAQVLDAGTARAIVVCKIMNTSAPVNTPSIDRKTGGVAGDAQFEVPYGLGYTMQRVGFIKRRWMHRYGITDEQIGWLCVTQRKHALLNPIAISDTPLTVEQYLQSKWIADPIHLLDCDHPVNGAFAYVLIREELARNDPRPLVYLLGWTGAHPGTMAPHLYPESGPGINPLARELYLETGLSAKDMDVWMLFDGFSFLAMQWMEELGLVPPGESGAYVEGGERILFSGEHPVNTHGGQLSEGRLHGAGHILEAIQQVRGTAGARQAKKADRAIITSAYPRDCEVAIVGRR